MTANEVNKKTKIFDINDILAAASNINVLIFFMFKKTIKTFNTFLNLAVLLCSELCFLNTRRPKNSQPHSLYNNDVSFIVTDYDCTCRKDCSVCVETLHTIMNLKWHIALKMLSIQFIVKIN